MDETITDQIEEVETEIVDTPDEEVNRVDELSDEEFNEEFDNESKTDESDDITETDENEPKDLDAIYASNLGTDAKLDEPMIVKVDGQVYELDSVDEIRNLIERGTGVTKKYQKLADDRRALEAQLEELGQVPNVESNDDTDEVEDVAQAILDSDYAESFTSDVQQLDLQTRNILSGNPEMLKELSIDYQNGLAQKIMPQVHRFMNVNGMSFEAAYVKAGKSYQSNVDKQEQDKPKVAMLKAQPKKTGKVTSTGLGEKAINAMSDTEFDAYFAGN